VTDSKHENAPDLTSRGRSHYLEHETGLEPATPTLARRCWPWFHWGFSPRAVISMRFGQ